MPVTFTKTIARLTEVCTVEEAMPLLDFFKATPRAKVDLSACVYLHSALLQLLLQVRPKITGWPTDPLLARWLPPLFTTDPQNA